MSEKAAGVKAIEQNSEDFSLPYPFIWATVGGLPTLMVGLSTSIKKTKTTPKDITTGQPPVDSISLKLPSQVF